MKQEVKYYRLLVPSFYNLKKGYIYPDNYVVNHNKEIRYHVNNSVNCFEEVSEETYKDWAMEMAQKYIGKSWKSIHPDFKGTINTSISKYIEIIGNYVCVGTFVVYNLETCEWAEIVSKPEEEKEEVIIAAEGGKKAERFVFNQSLIKSLSEIPEARKLLEKSGVIERDYVKEVFGRDSEQADELIDQLFNNCTVDKYSYYMDLKHISKALVQYVEGLERDKNNNQ